MFDLCFPFCRLNAAIHRHAHVVTHSVDEKTYGPKVILLFCLFYGQNSETIGFRVHYFNIHHECRVLKIFLYPFRIHSVSVPYAFQIYQVRWTINTLFWNLLKTEWFSYWFICFNHKWDERLSCDFKSCPNNNRFALIWLCKKTKKSNSELFALLIGFSFYF